LLGAQKVHTKYLRKKLGGTFMNWKSFIIGMLIGVFIGSTLFYELGERYEARGTFQAPIKIDKRTGKTWLLGIDRKWQELQELE
jgi:hypothetical protein